MNHSQNFMDGSNKPLPHTPMMWRERRVEYPLVLKRRAVSTILLPSNWWRLFDNSLCPPTKVVVLSLRTVFDTLVRKQNE